MKSWGWGPHTGISALVGRNNREFPSLFSVSLSLSAFSLSLSVIEAHREKAAICKPGRETLSEIKSVST